MTQRGLEMWKGNVTVTIYPFVIMVLIKLAAVIGIETNIQYYFNTGNTAMNLLLNKESTDKIILRLIK